MKKSQSSEVSPPELGKTKALSLGDNKESIDFWILFDILKYYKWVVVVSIVSSLCLSSVIAFSTQEWWSSNAIIVSPDKNGIVSYQVKVKEFQPAFDLYQDDGSIKVGTELDRITSPEYIFKMFIQEYNSSYNKEQFLNNNNKFKSLIESMGEVNSISDSWIRKINAKKVDKRNNSDQYEVSLQTPDSKLSHDLLIDYIQYIDTIVNKNVFDNLHAMIEIKYGELIQKKNALSSYAKLKIIVEIERIKSAIKISTSVGINKPLDNNIQDDSIFPILIGGDALNAKLAATKEIQNLSLIEPRLLQVNAKLTLIENLKAKLINVELNKFKYLDKPNYPKTRDKPNRMIIIIIGLAFGIAIGICLSFILYGFKKNNSYSTK